MNEIYLYFVTKHRSSWAAIGTLRIIGEYGHLRKYDSGYFRSAFKMINLPVYNGTIFSSFFTDQNLTPNCKQKSVTVM